MVLSLVVYIIMLMNRGKYCLWGLLIKRLLCIKRHSITDLIKLNVPLLPNTPMEN